MGSHSDIKKNSLLLKYAPETLQPYVLLARLDRPIGVSLLLLPALWAFVLASYQKPMPLAKILYLIILFTIGAILMRAAGCVINDLTDKDIDAKVERTRTRPLAQGDLTTGQTLLFLSLLLFLSAAILFQLTPTAILLGFAVIPLIAIYPLMKRITWWPQLFLGITFNFSALIGWAAVSKTLPYEAWLLYSACILWALAYDTIYAHQDIEDDTLIGVKSTARLFKGASPFFVFGFYGLAWALKCVTAIIVYQSYYALMALIPAGLYALYTFIQWDPDTPHSALKTFKNAQVYGLLVLLGFVAFALLHSH